MTKKNNVITLRFPGYFREFACTGSACGDTCCTSWRISAGRRSAAGYRKVKGEIGERLKQGIDKKTGSIIQKDGRCPFLNGENDMER